MVTTRKIAIKNKTKRRTKDIGSSMVEQSPSVEGPRFNSSYLKKEGKKEIRKRRKYTKENKKN